MYRDMRHLASWLGDDKSITILDYGCGLGAFLALLRDEFDFPNVEGLELSRVSVEFARLCYGLPIASSTAELHRRFYDYVILIEVLEHIPNPTYIFNQLRELVRQDGHLLITIPAVDNILGRFFPSECMHYTAPSHVSLFTRQALTCLLSRFGFEIERIETDEGFPTLDKFAMSLAYYLDFVSPRHDKDDNDAMYVPNAVGRLFGFQPMRSSSGGLFRRGLQRIDRFLMRRVWWRLPVVLKTDHLYVLARKRVIPQDVGTAFRRL
jgi:SAM-dependent methyltransferase